MCSTYVQYAVGVWNECGWVYRMGVGGCTEWVWVGVQYECGWVYSMSVGGCTV